MMARYVIPKVSQALVPIERSQSFLRGNHHNKTHPRY